MVKKSVSTATQLRGCVRKKHLHIPGLTEVEAALECADGLGEVSLVEIETTDATIRRGQAVGVRHHLSNVPCFLAVLGTLVKFPQLRET
jgi:hypothetical protein